MKKLLMIVAATLLVGCASNKVTVKAGKCFKPIVAYEGHVCYACGDGTLCYNDKGSLKGENLKRLEVEFK